MKTTTEEKTQHTPAPSFFREAAEMAAVGVVTGSRAHPGIREWSALAVTGNSYTGLYSGYDGAQLTHFRVILFLWLEMLAKEELEKAAIKASARRSK